MSTSRQICAGGCCAGGARSRATAGLRQQRAHSYERDAAFQACRRAVVEALQRRGQVASDVARHRAVLWPAAGEGGPARRCRRHRGVAGDGGGGARAHRLRRVGNVTVVHARAEDAQLGLTADAALFCAVHDILQSPGALRNVMTKLRPGAWVATAEASGPRR